MAKRKMHALYKLPYHSESIWTQCKRHLDDLSQIAAFEEGVTCKACLAAIQWSRDNEIDWAARRAAREENR